MNIPRAPHCGLVTLTLAAGSSVPVLRYTQRCKGPPRDSLLFEPHHLGEGVTLFCKTPEIAMAQTPALLTLHPQPPKRQLECVTRPDSQAGPNGCVRRGGYRVKNEPLRSVSH